MGTFISKGGFKLYRLPTYGLTPSTGSVNEGESVTFTLATDGPDGTFYWTNGGTTTAADFSDDLNNGSFVTSGGVGTITRTLKSDLLTEGSETLILEVRTGSVAGTIVATASTVTVNDTSTAPAGLTPNWTVGSGGDFATLDAALASPSVVNGNYIKVLPGTYTISSLLTVNKEVIIGGTPGVKGDVVLQSTADTAAPATLMQVSANNVVLKDLTIKHRKTNNTSVETALLLTRNSGGVNVRVDGFIMDSVRIEHVEFGFVARGNDFKVANCEIAYVGPNNSTRRHVGLYGTGGTCFFTNNAFEDSTAGAITGNTNIFYLTSTTGLVASERFNGTLVVDGNTWVSSTSKLPNQFFNQDNCASDGTFNLMFKNNVMNEKNAFVVLYGSTANFGNSFGDITFYNNTLSNIHTNPNTGGKGMLTIDGAGSNVSWRSSNLVAHIDGNALTNSTFRATSTGVLQSPANVTGPEIGRTTAAIASFTADVDATIPATPTAPSTPSLL